MKANDILKLAGKTLNESRNKEYGDFSYNLAVNSILWEGYQEHHVDPIDVAVMMALFKINRIRANKEKLDSYVDAIAYLAAAAEMAGQASSSSSSS